MATKLKIPRGVVAAAVKDAHAALAKHVDGYGDAAYVFAAAVLLRSYAAELERSGGFPQLDIIEEAVKTAESHTLPVRKLN